MSRKNHSTFQTTTVTIIILTLKAIHNTLLGHRLKLNHLILRMKEKLICQWLMQLMKIHLKVNYLKIHMDMDMEINTSISMVIIANLLLVLSMLLKMSKLSP